MASITSYQQASSPRIAHQQLQHRGATGTHVDAEHAIAEALVKVQYLHTTVDIIGTPLVDQALAQDPGFSSVHPRDLRHGERHESAAVLAT